MAEPNPGDLPAVYEIRVKGWMDSALAANLFPGLTLLREKRGESVLRGPLADQAALFGLLNQMRNLAVPLLSVRVVRDGGLPANVPHTPPAIPSGAGAHPAAELPNAALPYPAGEAVLVTGCSSGIGLAAALYLAMRSFTVLATVRREADAERLRGFHLEGLEPVCPLDLSRPDDLPAASAAIRAALQRRGLDRLYAVVNNAGGGQIAPVELMDRVRFRAEMETRVHGPVALLQDLLPLLRKARGGRILWISTPAMVAIPYVGSIHACEFAMNGIVQTLRLELSPWNIPSILIGCGGIRTAAPGRTDRELEQAMRTWPADRLDLYARTLEKLRTGFARFDASRTSPEAVAQVVCRALLAEHPRRKYLVGSQARAMSILPLLPASLVEWAMAKRL